MKKYYYVCDPKETIGVRMSTGLYFSDTYLFFFDGYKVGRPAETLLYILFSVFWNLNCVNNFYYLN